MKQSRLGHIFLVKCSLMERFRHLSWEPGVNVNITLAPTQNILILPFPYKNNPYHVFWNPEIFFSASHGKPCTAWQWPCLCREPPQLLPMLGDRCPVGLELTWDNSGAGASFSDWGTEGFLPIIMPLWSFMFKSMNF